MSERQSDTARFKQDLDEHITKSDEPGVTESKHWSEVAAEAAIPDETPLGAAACAGVAPPFYQVPGEQKWVNFEIKPIEERRRLLADAIRTALAGYVVVERETVQPLLDFIAAFDERNRLGLADELCCIDGLEKAIRASDLRKLALAAPPARKET